ncbi:Hsp70 family protein [Nocardia cyriacigeorgica]|uniref:Hsp70 family protein n=1 Tax=Nocardia cyriacigeorgica TaxID=135487 RepID=A0A6P1CW81_9NOCA|nr:Hsp70 family protein [Nocardia cyriacigeorgica]MBF6287689.1 Hsp70 family protein [Nocardia cyriacigeorgica]NEW36771.1 Hsp70 family protein [Nocardia cyriacigeorgica]
MTQRLALGITVGSANSVAVVAHRDGEPGIDSALVLTHPTVLRLVPDGTALFGTEAVAGGRHAPGVRIDGFVSRVGDPVPMLADDGTSYAASDLVATAIAHLVDEAADAPATIVACHPAHWTPHTVSTLRTALDDAGLADVALTPEPVAAVRWSCAAGRTGNGDGAVLVYDLGATGLTVSVVRTGDRLELLGAPVHSTDIAGTEFDLLTMRYVLANAPGGIAADPFDPAVERELSALRERCRIAKEELSTHTATVVTTGFGPDESTVRLVRDELEDLLRTPLRDSMSLIRDAVHRAGIDIGDVHQVLLTGGGGAIGLLTELISSEFGLPVVSAPEPAHTSALGASALAADLADTAVETIAFAAVDDQREAPGEPVTEPVKTSSPLPLPADTGRPAAAKTRRRRIAIVAAAAAAIGLLATGTVAVSTGAGSGTQHPAAPEHTTSSTAGTPATAGGSTATAGGSPTTGGTSAGTVADSGTPKDTAGQPNSSTGPVTVVNSQPGPAAREGAPAPAGQPGSAPSPAAPGPGQAPQPAPQAPAPAPQSPPPAPQSPPPAPAPQPPAPAPQQPQTPKLPTDGLTDTLGETVEGVGGTVGTVLRAPGEILGGSGG